VLKKMWPVLKRIRPDLAIDERGFLRNQNPHGGYWCPSESERVPLPLPTPSMRLPPSNGHLRQASSERAAPDGLHAGTSTSRPIQPSRARPSRSTSSSKILTRRTAARTSYPGTRTTLYRRTYRRGP
jgi:hypothetical protein